MIQRVAATLLVVLVGCTPSAPSTTTDRDGAEDLLRDLYETGWTQAEPYGIAFNYVQREARDRAVGAVSVMDVVATKRVSGAKVAISYIVFRSRWEALGDIFAKRRTAEEGARELSSSLRDFGDNGHCFTFVSNTECATRADNVVVHVLSRLTSLGRRGASHIEDLTERAIEHLEAVRRGAKAPQLPTTPPDAG